MHNTSEINSNFRLNTEWQQRAVVEICRSLSPVQLLLLQKLVEELTAEDFIDGYNPAQPIPVAVDEANDLDGDGCVISQTVIFDGTKELGSHTEFPPTPPRVVYSGPQAELDAIDEFMAAMVKAGVDADPVAGPGPEDTNDLTLGMAVDSPGKAVIVDIKEGLETVLAAIDLDYNELESALAEIEKAEAEQPIDTAASKPSPKPAPKASPKASSDVEPATNNCASSFTVAETKARLDDWRIDPPEFIRVIRSTLSGGNADDIRGERIGVTPAHAQQIYAHALFHVRKVVEMRFPAQNEYLSVLLGELQAGRTTGKRKR